MGAWIAGIGRPRERGASGVEVALLIAIVAMVVFAAVDVLGSRSGSKLNQAGAGIHQPTDPGAGGAGSGGGDASPVTDVPIPTTAPGDTSPATSVPISTVPATTVPVSTVPATTVPVSTVPPTTAPATTTTTAPLVAGSSFSASASTVVSSTRWSASATLEITDQAGAPLAGAQVTVLVRTLRISRTGTATWVETTITATVADDGHVDLATGPYVRSGTNRITQLQYVVQSVTPNGSGTWDGTPTFVTVDAP